MSDVELVITRGFPGSGKTTFAREWVAHDPQGRARVNRDDLRDNLYGERRLSFEQEQAITVAQRAAVRALLCVGKSVIVDDTHLRLRHARAWADLALEVGVDFVVEDFHTPLDQCIAWDIGRDDKSRVGGDVILDLAKRFAGWHKNEVRPSERKSSVAPRPYVPNDFLPKAWMVDIDGTLAHMVNRGPYDIDKVEDDEVDTVIADLVSMLSANGYEIIIMSGRSDDCEDATLEWLDYNIGTYTGLYMRDRDDKRPDYLVKADLFDKYVRDTWNVVGVLDDRDQVVQMWRSMGLKTLQVADGNF